MQDTRMILACLTAAVVTAIAIMILRRLAPGLGLVDHPSDRKHHEGSVPLIGGLGIFLGVGIGALCYHQLTRFGDILLATSGVLVIIGALDDRFDLRVRTRLLAQVGMTIAVILTTGVHIHTLGHIFGQELELGWFGYPLTVVAVIGLVNAFNMMDGIDGLAGGLALVSIGAISLFAGESASSSVTMILALLAGAAMPYMAANLGLTGRKIFMGDAGSMVIGYLLAWILIRISQQPGTHLSPVDVLWCVALPVLDTLAVMYRRMRKGQSPFKPDRGHIHHIVMGLGLGPTATLVVLIALAATIASIGKISSTLGMGPGANLAVICLFAISYITIVESTWARLHERNTALALEIATELAALASSAASLLPIEVFGLPTIGSEVSP